MHPWSHSGDDVEVNLKTEVLREHLTLSASRLRSVGSCSNLANLGESPSLHRLLCLRIDFLEMMVKIFLVVFIVVIFENRRMAPAVQAIGDL